MKWQIEQFYKSFILTTVIISTVFFAPVYSAKQNTVKNNESEKISSSTVLSQENKIFIELPDNIETDDNGVAIIQGKTIPNAEVKIGYGIVGNKTKSDSNGQFTLKYELKKNSKVLKINIKKDHKKASQKVTINASQKKIEYDKYIEEADKNFGKEPKDMKSEASVEALKRFKVDRENFFAVKKGKIGSFEFHTAKILDTSVGKILVLQYYLSVLEEDTRYGSDGKDSLPYLLSSLKVEGKAEGQTEYKEDMIEYLYDGVRGGIMEDTTYKELNVDDYARYPILNDIKNSTKTDNNQYPIGEKVLKTEAYYLPKNNIQSVHITLKQAPKAEIWLKS